MNSIQYRETEAHARPEKENATACDRGENAEQRELEQYITAYVAAGFIPIRVRENSKVPADKGWQSARAEDALTRLAGHRGNIGVTFPDWLFALDVDCKDGAPGEDSLLALEMAHGTLPATLEQRTPSGGRHLIFRKPPLIGFRNTVGVLGNGLDIRATGGQIVAEPSTIDGKDYAWLDWDMLAGEAPAIADAPQWLIDLLSEQSRPPGGAALAEGSRNNQLFRRACAMRGKGMDFAEIQDDLIEINKACSPPLPLQEVAKIAASAARYPAGEPDEAPPARAERPQPPARQAAPYPEPFPGPMATLHAQALLASPKPQPRLATLACLVGMAGAIPGIYRFDDGSRCNLYGLGVAKSGDGKDAVRMVAEGIITAGGGKLIGQPASGEGLEDALESRRGMLCALDEVAHIVAALNHQKAPPHMLSMARNVLTLYSASRTRYALRMRAKKERAGSPAETEMIDFPCLSLLGFATPEKLGEAATAANVEDGLLGRMLFALGDDNPPHVRPRDQFSVAPQVEYVAQQIGNAHRHINAGDDLSAYLNPEIVIGQAADASTFLDEVLARFSEQTGKATDDPLQRTLCVRSFEKVFRVSGVLAVWDNPRAPQLERGHVEWALRLVEASNADAREFLSEYMHGGQVQAHAAEIMRALAALKRRDKVSKVQHSTLLHRVSKRMNAQEFGIAIAHLEELEDIEREEVTATSGRKVFFYG